MIRRGKRRVTHDQPRVDSKYRLPETNPLSMKYGLLLVGGTIAVGLGIGVAIGTQVFFGTAAMVGLAILVESSPHLLWLVEHGNIWIDLFIFAGSIYALFKLGPTIAGAAIITGIEYTGVYAPAIRNRAKRRRNKNRV